LFSRKKGFFSKKEGKIKTQHGKASFRHEKKWALQEGSLYNQKGVLQKTKFSYKTGRGVGRSSSLRNEKQEGFLKSGRGPRLKNWAKKGLC